MLYTTFYDILNDVMGRPHLDVYVTGSNSKILSKAIMSMHRHQVPSAGLRDNSLK